MGKRAERIAWGLILGGAALVILLIGAFVIDQWLDAREEEREQLALLATLTPAGAVLLQQSEGAETCNWHVTRKLRTTRAAVEAWAKQLRLWCYEPDPLATNPAACTRWRSDNPAVDVELNETTVVIDSRHGYLCGGPFQ